MAFENTEPNINSGGIGSIVVTPSNSVNLTSRIRGVTLNVGGTLSYVGWDGVAYATDTLPQGTYAVMATRINATGTTATGITGWI